MDNFTRPGFGVAATYNTVVFLVSGERFSRMLEESICQVGGELQVVSHDLLFAFSSYWSVTPPLETLIKISVGFGNAGPLWTW
jgi:hypothetical protein